jgi:hypothetical protein
MQKSDKIYVSIPLRNITSTVLVLLLVFSFIKVVFATAPNPGHNFTEVGGGAVQGALAKDTNSTRYLSNTGSSNNPAWAQVNLTNGVSGSLPVTNGGTGWGAVQANTVVIGNGTNAIATTSAGVNGYVLALVAGVPTWVATTTLTNISGTLPLTSGGTNASLSASTGGIVYSGASAFAVLAGTATAGQVLRSGASAAPTWSTATYPATVGTAGQVLMSDGTNWVSSATSTYPIVTVVTRPVMATGAVTTGTAFGTSLITAHAGLFNVPNSITVNQLTYNVTIGGTSPSYTAKVCVYNEANTVKLIDVTSGAMVASGVNSVTVSPAVTLVPGNYYILVGLATQSGTSPTINFSVFTSTAATWINTSATPSGKKIYEGTLAKASGVCDATMATITGTISKTPVIRLDN